MRKLQNLASRLIRRLKMRLRVPNLYIKAFFDTTYSREYIGRDKY